MSRAQELQLELIKISSFNNFDGEQVAKSLLDNKHLWIGVVIDSDRNPFVGMPDLIKLRDIDGEGYNVDTLYISCVPGQEKDLKLLVLEEWNPDEVDWIDKDRASSALGTSHPEYQVLRVWWD